MVVSNKPFQYNMDSTEHSWNDCRPRELAGMLHDQVHDLSVRLEKSPLE